LRRISERVKMPKTGRDRLIWKAWKEMMKRVNQAMIGQTMNKIL
jgi:IS1 family transposase